MSHLEELAEPPWERAAAVTDACIAQVVGDVGVVEPRTTIAELGLSRENRVQLSGLLLEQTDTHISPSAIAWCGTVEELSYVVERAMQAAARRRR